MFAVLFAVVLLLAGLTTADKASDAVVACQTSFAAMKKVDACEALKELEDCLAIIAPGLLLFPCLPFPPPTSAPQL
jgi:hypothetical protein